MNKMKRESTLDVTVLLNLKTHAVFQKYPLQERGLLTMDHLFKAKLRRRREEEKIFLDEDAEQDSEIVPRMLPEKLYGPTLISVDFEVHGIVQGVYFPRYCQDMCRGYGIRGWVRNSKKGTIIGQLQGEKEKVDEMAMWLRLQGSPGSKITRCDFRKWSIIDGYDYRDFRINY